MRALLIGVWLVVPFALAGYHWGPGQERLVLDRADALMRAAERLDAAGQPGEAVARWDQALALLPAEQVAAARRARLERCKAAMQAEGLLEARAELEGLLTEVQGGPDPALEREVRTALASAQFYVTWLMKLEGQPREEWEPEIEGARQHYSLLAESSVDAAERAVHQRDLEAAVRLERADPDELRGQPLPCQCQGCSSCQGKKPGKKPGKKGKGSKPGPKDARGASMGPPADEGGS